MKVTPTLNRNPKSTNALAMIEGLPAWFPFDMQPPPDVEVEVMITGMAYHKDERGYYDYKKPKCFFIRPIIPGVDQPVVYDGFECSGSMCSTTARATLAGGERVTITPGRTGVYYADNVNAAFYNQAKMPLRPGSGWIRNLPGRMPRLEGVAEINMLEFFANKQILEQQT